MNFLVGRCARTDASKEIRMAHSDFVHLHLHTQYSLLDGACRIPEILALAKQYKMDSLAITQPLMAW